MEAGCHSQHPVAYAPRCKDWHSFAKATIAVSVICTVQAVTATAIKDIWSHQFIEALMRRTVDQSLTWPSALTKAWPDPLLCTITVHGHFCCDRHFSFHLSICLSIVDSDKDNHVAVNLSVWPVTGTLTVVANFCLAKHVTNTSFFV